MNIFYLDKDLQKSSQYLVNKHIVKMPLEHTQLLCTAKRLVDGTKINADGKVFYLIEDEELMTDSDSGKVIIANPFIYKHTHISHPSALWVRESLSNYKWLIRYTEYMLKEYTYRYGKVYKVTPIIEYLKKNPPKIEDKGFTKFALAMPNECKLHDPIQSYRLYYRKYKQHLFSWKNREAPEWITL